MKKTLAFLLAALMVFALAACTPSEAPGTPTPEAPSTPAPVEPNAPEGTGVVPGTYTASASGNNADIVVEVTMGEDKIEHVAITEQKESPEVAYRALEEIPQKIVEWNSIYVDTIAGATITSRAIMSAVAKAVAESGGKEADFTAKLPERVQLEDMTNEPLPAVFDETYDIVVVGSGFAGLAAAHTAAENGAKTLLVEKMPITGGNSKVNGGVYAAYTSSKAAALQEKFNLVPDTAEKHIEDTMAGGDQKSTLSLVENLVYGSPVYLNLLFDNGLEVRETLTRPGGHYGYRTYTTINGVGGDIVAVQKKMLQNSGAELRVDTKLVQLYREAEGDKKVVGVRVQNKDGSFTNIAATKGVIMASGGFSADVEMRMANNTQWADLGPSVPTTNHPGATGEGIKIAQAVGAAVTQMDYIQLYPFANPINGVLDATAVIPFSGPSSGVVYVDSQGKRYVNEGERRDVCANGAMNSGGFPTFCIFNQNIKDNAGFIADSQLADGMAANRIIKADTLEELAALLNEIDFKGQKVNIDGATLKATIETHNTYVQNENDPDFGKVIDKGVMLTMEEGPYYAVPQWPSVHHTMGGLMINRMTQVLDADGNIIPNLYGAGEVTGGVHGTNRLGSNAIPDACVHGMIAGTVATTGEAPDFVPES